VDHGDGQERAPCGQLGCGDPSRHAQTGGAQVQLAPHKLRTKEGETEKELVQ
jgi:hypothetical protein